MSCTKTLVPWLCSRSQPGIKVSIRRLLGAFVTYCSISVFFLVFFFLGGGGGGAVGGRRVKSYSFSLCLMQNGILR